MANDSIKDRIGEWVDKAGDYADTIREKTNEYADKFDQFADKFNKKAESGVGEVKNGVRSVVNNARNSANEYANKTSEEKARVANRTQEFENRAEESIRNVRDTAKDVKRDAAINKTVIQRRADRFAEGVDAVAEDLEKQQRGSLGIGIMHGTAPIDGQGNYKAVDGTVNNLKERLEIHTEKTKERMREDASGRKKK